MYRKTLDYELAAKLLHADFDEGKLYWKERPLELFNSKDVKKREGYCRYWNRRFAGQLALNTLQTSGYLCGYIFDVSYASHRVIWLLAHGEMPEYIDHMDRCKTNNKLSNLRSVTLKENQRNRGPSARNTSGYVGVSFQKKTRKWYGGLKGINNENIFVGPFDTALEAHLAREKVKLEHGYFDFEGYKNGI